MPVTIKDVAEAARVSIATVSHVLNETRYVSENTKKKVHNAIRELNYIPNVNAAGLRGNRTKRVGFLVPEIGSFFSVDIMGAVEQVLKQYDYQLILGCSHDNIEIEREQVNVFMYQQVDGMIIFPAPGNHSYLDRLQRRIPIVFIDREAEGCTRDLFIGDNEVATHDVVVELIREGHRRIGVINGIYDISSTNDRVKGYKRALAENGILFDPELIGVGVTGDGGVYRAMQHLIRNKGISAVIALTSSLSLECMMYLTEHDISVPEQVAVVSFGETDWAKISKPPLTTLRHPLFEMGMMASKCLLRRIEEESNTKGKKAPYETVRLPIELIRRQSF